MGFSPKLIKLLMLIAPCLMTMSGMVLYIRLAQPKTLEAMISALPSSYWLTLNIATWGKRSLRSRLQLTGAVSAVLFWPIKNLHIRHNKLNQKDIDDFPRHLRRQLLICNCLTYLGAIWLGITYFFYN